LKTTLGDLYSRSKNKLAATPLQLIVPVVPIASISFMPDSQQPKLFCGNMAELVDFKLPTSEEKNAAVFSRLFWAFWVHG